ncbi:MAG TPA: tRNA (adenosine(37)-N6)-threonylcarbamoyltransferase complex dimerization subunit type 1 TsaB, partial [Comamonadaceae bacterium]|nr:tRNA (adenosine(37)-N6)-threonylcarbamoyltransferase complex dimerization subunit type 1 TsaB [Comamonadaceae bacterium]
MKLLAFDTSTDTLSIAVQAGEAVWQHSGPGGAQASATLIPAIRGLLAQAGLSFDTLDAIVFGRGPGSFTGLRTACAVAQGLAFGARGGAGVPVLPVDTLLAVAEDARQQHGCTRVVATLDARMDEVYVARCEWVPAPDGLAGHWRADEDFGLCAPEAVQV